MRWVVEMTGYDPVADQVKTVRFAMGEGIAFTDQPYAPGALQKWASASQRIEFSSTGTLNMKTDGGDIVIANFPDDAWSEGPWDDLANWVWQNQPVSLYVVPGRVWAQATRVTGGVLEQPVATLDVGGGYSSVLRFPIRDPRQAYETPLQPAKYLGDNVGPAGIEGDAALKGRPKPIVYGLVSNVSPPQVNSSLLIYQISDKPVSIVCVRDGAVPLAAGTVRANLASLQGNNPAGGRYDILHDAALGTFIRLGSNPIYNITVDADEAPNEAGQSHANIWARLRQRIEPAVVLHGIAAANAVDGAGAGFYWESEISQNDALSEVLASFSGYEVQRDDGSWEIAKLLLPAGDPVIELVQLTPTTRMKAISRPLQKLAKARPSYAPDGAPPFRVNVRWGRNYTVMDKQQIAGVVGDRLKQKFAEEFRIASATDLDVWNPETKAGPWKNAPELTIDTAYQPGDDGILSPGAQAEADRLLALLGPLRAQYQTAHLPAVGESLRPGQVVRVIYPRMGLSAGALFRILEVGFSVEKNIPSTEMVIGLQA